MAENTQRTEPKSAGTNGQVSANQNQPMGGSDAILVASQSVSKGGMRGLGLMAVLIAEAALKKKSVDLAEDYLNTNKREYANFVAIHQGAISQTVSEAMSPTSNPEYKADFYASAPAGMAKSAVLDKQWFETRRRVHRYAVGLQGRIDFDFAIGRMHGIVAGWFLGRRYEMAYADEHNNRRFDRKIEASNIGIGIGNIVREGLANAVNKLATSYDNIGDTVSAIGNGYAKREAYRDGRQFAKDRFPKE